MSALTTESDLLTGSSLIGAADVRPEGATFRAVDPATGAELDPPYEEAGAAEVERAATLADQAFADYRRTNAEQRYRSGQPLMR